MSDWRVIGASVTGTSHLRAGRGCDDAHAYRTLEPDHLLIAVADGAGSALRSARGAATAAQVAIDAAGHMLSQQVEPSASDQWLSVLTYILTTAREALVLLTRESVPVASDLPGSASKSAAEMSSLRDFATTLLIAIVTAHWIAVAQIGDGAVVIQLPDGSTTSLTPSYRGEYINETCFLTDAEYLARADYTILPRAGTQGIALLTDGLQLVAMNFPENTPHQPFFTPLFKFAANPEAQPEELQRFLESERICARTDDDKTLVLAVYP